MGVYQRTDSPYWWMHLENAPRGQQNVSTKVRIGYSPDDKKASRVVAEAVYHARALHAVKVQHGLPIETPEADLVRFDTVALWYDTQWIAKHKGHEREREMLPRLRAAFGPLALTDPRWRTLVIEWRTHRLTTPTVIKHFGGPKGKKRTLPPPSARTVNREVDLLQQILAEAVKAGHLETSPLYGLEDLPVVKPTRRIMGEAEEAAVLAELDAEDGAILLVGLLTLARMGDILDLKRTDDHGHALDIRDPKNGEPLTVPIATRLRRALDKVPVDPEQPVWYFPGRRGAATERDRRAGYTKALQRACARADVPYGRAKGGLTFHWATRRTGATRMIRRGGEKAIGVVQQIGGWKDPTVLIGIYQETITEEMRAAVETISAAPRRPGKLRLVRTVSPLLRKAKKRKIS